MKDIQIKINPKDVPLPANLGVLGVNGITAYAGLLDKCKPKKGETVVVTTAAGSVGSAVGQIAKFMDVKLLDLLPEEKNYFALMNLIFDEVINYKSIGDISAYLKKIAPNGVTVFLIM